MNKINLLAICASPRKNGNTFFLMNEALKILENSEIPVNVTQYLFAGKRFQPCIGCKKCRENGGICILKDDFAELRKRWMEADAVIYFVPVYVAGIPGHLKCFIERLNNSEFTYYPVASMRHMKPIGSVAQGADFTGGQEFCSFDIMRHAAMINCIYVAPDGAYFCSGGWANGPTGEELKRKCAQETDDIKVTLATARSIIKRCVEMAAILKAGANALRAELRDDPRYASFYDLIDSPKQTEKN